MCDWSNQNFDYLPQMNQVLCSVGFVNSIFLFLWSGLMFSFLFMQFERFIAKCFWQPCISSPTLNHAASIEAAYDVVVGTFSLNFTHYRSRGLPNFAASCCHFQSISVHCFCNAFILMAEVSFISMDVNLPNFAASCCHFQSISVHCFCNAFILMAEVSFISMDVNLSKYV